MDIFLVNFVFIVQPIRVEPNVDIQSTNILTFAIDGTDERPLSYAALKTPSSQPFPKVFTVCYSSQTTFGSSRIEIPSKTGDVWLAFESVFFMNVFQVRVDPGVYFYYDLAEGSFNKTRVTARSRAWVHVCIALDFKKEELAYYEGGITFTQS